MNERVKKLLALMSEHDTGAMLVTKPNNMRYLAGYLGEGCMLITAAGPVILTDFRYTEMAGIQSPGVEVVQYDSAHPMHAQILERLRGAQLTKLAVEEDQMTVQAHRQLSKALEGIELVPAGGLIEKLRIVKDASEIDSIRRACAISCKAFDKMLSFMKPGMTEREVQLELDYTMLRLGSEGVAFSTIACAGVNGSLPHAIPGDHVIAKGEMLTLDFGAVCDGYKADMTRTVAFGQLSDELRAIYDTVLQAQLNALDAVAPGVICRDVDKVARDYIDARYKGAFGHSLGHGVGLDIHEQPGFNFRDERPLVPGHIITVEPGVYIPGVGGCRIEDTIAITADGYENLVTAPKDLITL